MDAVKPPGKGEEVVALVTGASSGMGRAVAHRFGARGGTVVLLARDGGALDSVRQEIRSAGGTAISLRADVSQQDEVYAAAQHVLDEFGAIDVLVNNAGQNHHPQPLLDTPPELWDRMFAVNATGPFLVSRAFAPSMVERGAGVIVNIASVGALTGGWGRGAYRAAKAAMANFSESLAAELNQYGVRVHCLCPGPTATALTAETTLPSDTMLSVEQVADVVEFLASPRAVPLTGCVLPMWGPASPLFSNQRPADPR